MHILIVDHSVVAYKAFMRLFTQDYEGETNDELWEFSSQYVSEIQYLQELHKPDGMLFVMDCPRDEIWRHRVVRRYYGERANIHPVEWMPAMSGAKTPENAVRWHVECDHQYKYLWKDADGGYKSKHMTKKAFNEWAREQADLGLPIDKVTDKKVIREMLPYVAKMYKGSREGSHFPKSAVMDKNTFKVRSRELARKVAPHFNGRVVEADRLEADDLAYAATARWYKHDITVATVDRDWLQLGMHMSRYHSSHDAKGAIVWNTRECGTFRFWDMGTYDFLDTDNPRLRKLYVDKLLRGDVSDCISSTRYKGKTTGIGDKARDKIFDEVADYAIFTWMEKNLDTASLMRNVELINLAKIPKDLAKVAEEAILSSKVEPVSVPLTDLASPATLSLAKTDGQKARLTQKEKQNAKDRK